MNHDAWMRRYNELRDFKNREGHCNVPQHYNTNRRLGTWVNRQRTHYRYMREGKPSSMTSQRVKSLQDIGLKWNLNKHERSRSTYDAAWHEKYKELKIFKSREGHCNVPQHYSANESLGRWVNKQRLHYKYMREGKRSCMRDERVKKLEDIGFQWSLNNYERSRSTYDAAWLLMYEELKTFKCREGHCNVPTQYSANKTLGVWVSNQRVQYKYMVEGKQTSITEQRIKALNAIGFSWSMRNNNMKTKTPAPTPCLVPSNPSVS